VISVSIANAKRQPASAANPTLRPGDRLYVFSEKGDRGELLATELDRIASQARYGEQEQTITALGEVTFPGTYPLEPGMRASDLLCAAGGLTRKAFGVVAELSRIEQALAFGNETDHVTLDAGEVLRLCQMKRQAERGALDPATYEAAYNDDLLNPELSSMDQIAFREKIGWVERATVKLSGEFVTPGVYAIDRGETLCQLVVRAGGLTDAAYSFGGEFTRRSIREMQQETLDELRSQLDDLMINLSLSHSFNNQEKQSHEWAGKQDYLRAIKQFEHATASGRMVVDLDEAIKCKSEADVVLEDGDELYVPTRPNFVQVAGQVYVPTSHLFREDRKIIDYIEMSGGHTTLGELSHAYVIQANGEVLNYKGRRQSSRIKRDTVNPGARIFVPIDVDRMNTTEKAQTWVQTLVNSALLAGIIL
jgi:protein involved in polysaccharide export with SLBB domain